MRVFGSLSNWLYSFLFKLDEPAMARIRLLLFSTLRIRTGPTSWQRSDPTPEPFTPLENGPESHCTFYKVMLVFLHAIHLPPESSCELRTRESFFLHRTESGSVMRTEPRSGRSSTAIPNPSLRTQSMILFSLHSCQSKKPIQSRQGCSFNRGKDSYPSLEPMQLDKNHHCPDYFWTAPLQSNKKDASHSETRVSHHYCGALKRSFARSKS